MGVLTDPFVQNAFMQRALLAGILVAIATGVVGTLMVLRGMAFLGDALAHGVLPGIAAALLIGIPSFVGALVGAAVMIGGVAAVQRRTRLSSDVAIGLLFVGMLVVGGGDRVEIIRVRGQPHRDPVWRGAWGELDLHPVAGDRGRGGGVPRLDAAAAISAHGHGS